MAKKIYIGIDGVARRVKKGYIGIDGIARKLKKAYIGIGGIARPCWNGGELYYFGNIAKSSIVERSEQAATTIGDYALFAGGRTWSDIPNVGHVLAYEARLFAYDKSLTLVDNFILLNGARSKLAAATIGDYALFAGGGDGTARSTVDAYDKSLTRTNPTELSAARFGLAAATIGDYALFAGGETSEGFSAVVDAYDKSLTRTTQTALSTARSELAATTIGDYALFAGGQKAEDQNGFVTSSTVDVYNKSLTLTSMIQLSVLRSELAAATIGGYALFAGGKAINITAKVDAYDKSLIRTHPTALSAARFGLAAATIGDYALFAGGETSKGFSAVVDSYDKSLTRMTQTALSTARSELAATTIGAYALFAGGKGADDVRYNTVDVYSV